MTWGVASGYLDCPAAVRMYMWDSSITGQLHGLCLRV